MRARALLLAGFILLSFPLSGAGIALQGQQAPTDPGEETLPSIWQPVPGAAPASFDPERLARLRDRAESRAEPENWLAFGAALLQTGDWQGAAPPLRAALDSDDSELREVAAYDLALAWAVAGSPGASSPETTSPGSRPVDPQSAALDDPGTPRDRLLRARDGFRAVLRADPMAEDARWNLELVERWLEQEGDAGSSGEGAEAGAASDGTGPGEGSGGAPMTPEEARRLLEAAEGQEREVQARRLERNRERDPALDKNW
jgi:hypothetical protein